MRNEEYERVRARIRVRVRIRGHVGVGVRAKAYQLGRTIRINYDGCIEKLSTVLIAAEATQQCGRGFYPEKGAATPYPSFVPVTGTSPSPGTCHSAGNYYSIHVNGLTPPRVGDMQLNPVTCSVNAKVPGPISLVVVGTGPYLIGEVEY